MKQIRLIAAVGLSFLVLFVWTTFFTYNPEFDQSEGMSDIKESTVAGSFDVNQQNLLSDSEMPLQERNRFVSDYSQNPKELTVDTPLFRMVFSEKGALVKSAVLKNYKEEAIAGSQFKEIVSKQIPDGNVLTYFSGNRTIGNQESIFSSNLDDDYLKVTNDGTILTFTWTDGEGRTLLKSFTFRPNSYLINMKICVINTSEHVINDSLVLSLRDGKSDKSSYGFEGPSAFIDGRLKQFKTKDIDSTKMYNGHVDWIATEDRYFMSSIIPSSEFIGHVELGIEDKILENRIVSKPFQVNPGHQIDFDFSLFMGPKSITVLGEIGHSMEKAIYFGIFDFIAKPCLWFMNKIYEIVPNYGIAIIVLTVFTKLLLWPLGSKGYKSMNEMKRLQPLMAEIRERYKDNKQKMNQEIMTLYKTYKVNPVGGCLPMLLQIPVFFALYRMLYQAIELRHAPFLLWINDLAAPDRLLTFGFSIPFMQPPYGIPVLTIIMGATMLLQQKMSPPPGDPTQAKMMMFMPIVFTFIFINFSSGLVLYWLVNNILSISQQYYIQRKTT